MSTYTRSELENSGQCHQKSIGALPLSSMPRVEPGLILIIGVASCAYTIREISFREIHLMMNSRNIQPAEILRCTVLLLSKTAKFPFRTMGVKKFNDLELAQKIYASRD